MSKRKFIIFCVLLFISFPTLTQAQQSLSEIKNIETDGDKKKVRINENGEYVVTELKSNDNNFSPYQDDNRRYQIFDNDTIGSSKVLLPKIMSTRMALKRKQSTYKSLEEASRAVDERIAILKQQRDELNPAKKNSLSQKASKGVHGSLRKDSTENISLIITDSIYNKGTQYYINGIKATESEVEKLNPDDILKKERRSSEANSDGEWWIEVR